MSESMLTVTSFARAGSPRRAGITICIAMPAAWPWAVATGNGSCDSTHGTVLRASSHVHACPWIRWQSGGRGGFNTESPVATFAQLVSSWASASRLPVVYWWLGPCRNLEWFLSSTKMGFAGGCSWTSLLLSLLAKRCIDASTSCMSYSHWYLFFAGYIKVELFHSFDIDRCIELHVCQI